MSLSSNAAYVLIPGKLLLFYFPFFKVNVSIIITKQNMNKDFMIVLKDLGLLLLV